MKRALLVFFVIIVGAAAARAQTPYFQGKTITIIVGYQSGDGYDIWSRLLAAHMSKYIAGTPGIIVQNMPGAGSSLLRTTCTTLPNPKA